MDMDEEMKIRERTSSASPLDASSYDASSNVPALNNVLQAKSHL